MISHLSKNKVDLGMEMATEILEESKKTKDDKPVKEKKEKKENKEKKPARMDDDTDSDEETSKKNKKTEAVTAKQESNNMLEDLLGLDSGPSTTQASTGLEDIFGGSS